MENQKTWNQNFLEELREKRPTYRAMVDFCADTIILNNYIIEALARKDLYFEQYSGTDRSFYNADGEEIKGAYEEYDDIYQYYIITESAAERFAEYTNELIYYNEELDLYLLCVKHFGTSWEGVPAKWKSIEELED